MKRYLQRGFSTVEVLLITLMVGLVAFIVWFVFHSTNDINKTLSNAENTHVQAPHQTANTSSVPETKPVVIVKSSTKIGKYLADSHGKTLYTYGAESKGESKCEGTCLEAWPVYIASTSSNFPANVSVITRSDGIKQYTYKDMPLYYYSNDIATGDVSGDGINNFHVAKP